MGSDEPIDFDQYRDGHVTGSQSAHEANQAWQLDQSLAFVVPAPGSIYSGQRPDYGARWDGLVEAMSAALSDRISADKRLCGLTVSRGHYSTAGSQLVGGPFGDLTMVFTLADDVNNFVQSASGWLAIAELIRGFYSDRQSISYERHEHDEHSQVTIPLPSMMGVKALCIANMLERFGLNDVPLHSIEARDTDPRHPDDKGRYIFCRHDRHRGATNRGLYYRNDRTVPRNLRASRWRGDSVENSTVAPLAQRFRRLILTYAEFWQCHLPRSYRLQRSTQLMS